MWKSSSPLVTVSGFPQLRHTHVFSNEIDFALSEGWENLEALPGLCLVQLSDRLRHVLEARYAKDVTEQTKDYTESLTLSRRIFLFGCVQHDMIALCEPVIILDGLTSVTFAALSLSFSKVFWVQSLFHSTHAFPEAPGAESYLPRRPSTVFAHGLHVYISEYVGCFLEISTGRDLRVGRACQNLLEY